MVCRNRGDQQGEAMARYISSVATRRGTAKYYFSGRSMYSTVQYSIVHLRLCAHTQVRLYCNVLYCLNVATAGVATAGVATAGDKEKIIGTAKRRSASAPSSLKTQRSGRQGLGKTSRQDANSDRFTHTRPSQDT